MLFLARSLSRGFMADEQAERAANDTQATGRTEQVFEALASQVRRKILAYLSASSLTAGEIAERFEISKPSVSKHLSILENAGLVRSEKRGQFVHYTLVRESLVNTLNGYVQEVCPVARPIKREAERKAGQKL
jgi:ArsR family transcriptional regulator, arsenate/arsenite/antimonite-responsive transcriptional repressor